MVPYSRNRDFVPRERIFDQLRGQLEPSLGTNQAGAHIRAALFGLGGVG